jgi:hypothetical protein
VLLKLLRGIKLMLRRTKKRKDNQEISKLQQQKF